MTSALRRILVAIAAIPLLLLSACSDDGGTPSVDTGAVDDAGSADADAGAAADSGADAAPDVSPDDVGATDSGPMDSGTADTPPDAQPDIGNDSETTDAAIEDVADDTTSDTGSVDASPDVVDDASSTTTVTLVGTISRSTNPGRGGDAIGDVFIALFDNEPIIDRDQTPVAFLIVESVDLSDRISTVAYRLDGIAPRSEPYWISAFLDDNGNASTDSAGPDRGDLVMLERFVPPASRQITLAEPGEVTYVIDLNNVLPF